MNPAASATMKVTIENQRGLHARASAKFVHLAEQFDAQVTVARAGERALATSIMGLMMLGASRGCVVELVAQGPDAEVALAALSALIADKFGED
jgi:phosphocarrier protein HPr